MRRLSLLESDAGGYVTVDAKVDSKIPLVKAPRMVLPEHVQAVLSVLKRKGLEHTHSHVLHRRHTTNEPLRVVCLERITATSGAATALTTVSSLIGNNSTDAKVFAVVYDESRCLSIDVKMNFTTRNASTGAPSSVVKIASGAIAFDPANNGTYSLLEQVLEAKEHIGPFNLNQPALAAQTTWTNKHGYVSLHCKPMPNVPTSTGAVIGSNWSSSTDTTAINGYLKPYVESCGTGIEFVVDYFVCYHMEFAFRT